MMRLAKLLQKGWSSRGVNVKPFSDLTSSEYSQASAICDLCVFTATKYTDYQVAYWAGKNQLLEDCRIVAFENNEVSGFFDVFIVDEGERLAIIGSSLRVRPPALSEALNDKRREFLTRSFVSVLLECFAVYSNDNCSPVDLRFSVEFESTGSEHFLDQILSSNLPYRVDVLQDLFLSLEPSLDQIYAGFRKSYRPLIRKWENSFTCDTSWDVSSDVWEEFLALHFICAGRKTRSDNSWALQKKALDEKKALLTCVRSVDDLSLVGGAYCFISPMIGLYGVGAYDKAKTDRPVGHLAQWSIIKKLKELGIDKYYLGALKRENEKLQAIGLFKAGFGASRVPNLIFTFSAVV